MNKKLNAALVGFGAVARNAYLPALSAAGFVIRKISDPDADARAAARVAVPGSEIFNDLASIPTGSDLDAIIITAPPAAHCDALRLAAPAATALLVEKPLCLADQLSQLRAVSPTERVMVAHTRRFWPVYQELVRALHSGSIGALQRLDMVLYTAPPSTDHRRSPGQGGSLHDLAPHMLDLMWVICGGAPERIAATTSGEHWTIRCHYARDLAVTIRVGYGRRYTEKISVLGTCGALHLTNPYGCLRRSPRTSVRARLTDQTRRLIGVMRGQSMLRVSIEQTVRVFRTALSGAGPFSPGWEDGVRVVDWLGRIIGAADQDTIAGPLRSTQAERAA